MVSYFGKFFSPPLPPNKNTRQIYVFYSDPYAHTLASDPRSLNIISMYMKVPYGP